MQPSSRRRKEVATPKRRRKKTIAEECGVDAAIEVLDCIGGDLPDGAYFAMAEEMGLDPCDLATDADFEEGEGG